MKITCKQSDLAKGLSTVSHAVSSRSTLPILANILIVTDQENSRIKLSATNLEIGITCYVPATVVDPGSTTTPAKTISDLVGSLRPGQVELSLEDGHTMRVKGQGSNATVKGMDPEEFPVIPSLNSADAHLSFDARDLKEFLSLVTIAAADDDARPVLTGVHVEVRVDPETADEIVTFAAADAFRLAALSTTKHTGAHLLEPAIIPAKSLEQLRSILPNDGNVQVWISRSQAIFNADGVNLVSRLIEGTFPNFRGIMPKEHTTRAVVETREFAAAVKTVTPFARDSSNIARIKLTPSEDGTEDTLTIEATAEDVGSNVSTIPARVEGPEQTIIFNVKYLSDVLSVVGTPEIALEITSSSKPGIIRPVNGSDYIYLIMPMSQNR